jgi:hypothetical protein
MPKMVIEVPEELTELGKAMAEQLAEVQRTIARALRKNVVFLQEPISHQIRCRVFRLPEALRLSLSAR